MLFNGKVVGAPYKHIRDLTSTRSEYCREGSYSVSVLLAISLMVRRNFYISSNTYKIKKFNGTFKGLYKKYFRPDLE
jgi:hypothetical protein